MMSGADAARFVVKRAGAGAVVQLDCSERATAYYCPEEGRIHLGSAAYFGETAADIAIGAHEAAHAIQHQSLYLPMRLRLKLLPFFRRFALGLPFAMLAACLSGRWPLIEAVLWCYALEAIYCGLIIVIEVDASRRARLALERAAVKVDHAAVAAFLRRASFSYVFEFLLAPLALWRALRSPCPKSVA